jgi:hypothetical protein
MGRRICEGRSGLSPGKSSHKDQRGRQEPKSAEESRQKSEILEEKALEISKNMQSIPPGHLAYGYLKKEAEGKEQEAKQL